MEEDNKPTPIMLQFTLFPQLPTELQLLVWKAAVEEAGEKGRCILMDAGNRIRPTPQLQCPFLVTCRVSRDAALQFYSTKLDVFVDDPARDWKDTAQGERAGVVYLNLDERCSVFKDRFLEDVIDKCNQPSHPLHSPGSWKLPLKHTTAELPANLREQVVHMWEVIHKSRAHPIYLQLIFTATCYIYPNLTTHRLWILMQEKSHDSFVKYISRMSAPEFNEVAKMYQPKSVGDIV